MCFVNDKAYNACYHCYFDQCKCNSSKMLLCDEQDVPVQELPLPAYSLVLPRKGLRLWGSHVFPLDFLSWLTLMIGRALCD